MLGQILTGRGLVLLAACAVACTSSPTASSSSSSSSPLPVVAEQPAWVVGAAVSCASSTCTLTFRVEARGGFHANAEYPHRFVPDEGAVAVDPAVRVVRVDGDVISLVERTVAVTGPLRGRLFMSVCSDDKCLIEKVPVTLSPPSPPSPPSSPSSPPP